MTTRRKKAPRLEIRPGGEAAAAIEVAEPCGRQEYSEILTKANLLAHLRVPLSDARQEQALKRSMMDRALAAWVACPGRYNKPDVSTLDHCSRNSTTHMRLTSPRPKTTDRASRRLILQTAQTPT